MKETTKPRITDLLGWLLLLVGLPPFTYYVWICMDTFGGALVVPTADWLSLIPGPSLTAIILYISWFLLQAVLQIAAPGKIHLGLALADGSRLKYKMNGWFSFWFTVAVALLAVGLGVVPSTIFYDEFGPLLTTVNGFAFLLSGFLFVHGRSDGNAFRRFFMGSRLNPRIGDFDLKLFCEARPGLMLWILVNLSFAAKQYQLHGTVTLPMILVNLFQFIYIADYYFHEEAILSTWDIRHEKFGWMLCWGDLVWVPFMYSLQAHYLIHHTQTLSVPAAVGIVALNAVGYFIFRSANLQKHAFRKNPEQTVWGRPAEYIRTSRGTLLLTSGWWGIARHANYLGDLMMGLAWCLTTGFEHVLPYFYIVFFTILLVQREWRDCETCREKYGEDWDAYCRKVRWRILPGVY